VAWAEAYVHDKGYLDPATIDMARKLGALPSFWGGEAGSTSNTLSLGPWPTSLPSAILIQPAIWPRQIWAENLVGAVPLWSRESWIPM